MLSKDRLIFDPADLDESDNVGSYLRAGTDGDLISSTLIAGKEALDVNVVGSADGGIFAEDTAHVSGDNGQFILAVRSDADASLADTDGDYAPLQVDENGRLKVVADIEVANGFEKVEDTAHASGDVGAYILGVIQGTPAASAADGDYGSIKTDLLGRTWVNNAPNVSQAQGNVTVGATEVALPASALANRKKIIVQNTSNNDVFVGPTGVLTTTGIRIAKGATLELEAGPAIAMFAIAAGAGNDVRVWELA